MVPRGVEPARTFGERILSPFDGILPDLTRRDEPIFAGLAAVKARFIRSRLATECRHLSVMTRSKNAVSSVVSSTASATRWRNPGWSLPWALALAKTLA